MPTSKPRAMITFNDEALYKAVDEYRFVHRFRSQNEALMDLISKGIEVLLDETHADSEPADNLTDEERRILTAYHAAAPYAQMIALQTLENNPAEKKKNRA